MKTTLALLQESNQLLREERDSTIRATKEMTAKLRDVSMRCESTRRRIDLLRQKLHRPARQDG